MRLTVVISHLILKVYYIKILDSWRQIKFGSLILPTFEREAPSYIWRLF